RRYHPGRRVRPRPRRGGAGHHWRQEGIWFHRRLSFWRSNPGFPVPHRVMPLAVQGRVVAAWKIMPTKRRSSEAGHRRKFLVVIDDTPECARALRYAGRRAEHTGGAVVMLYVIGPTNFQHWMGVEN